MQKEIVERAPARTEPTSAKYCWHVITSEYPPQTGGVSDYTAWVAQGLVEEGDQVHVWCPPCDSVRPERADITLHPELGTFSPPDFRRVGMELDRFEAPRRLLVQWVPHGYGYRSMNLAICWWLWKRAIQHGDQIELMVHEPFLQFSWRSPRQNAPALVHRLMTLLLLRAARRVWISIPGWEAFLRPYALGRPLAFEWLPIFSNIPVADDPARTQAIRRRYADGDRILIGHFGTYGNLITGLLEPIILSLAGDSPQPVILLIGGRSEQFRENLIRRDPRLADCVRATGRLPADEISHHLAACDLLMQPYPDGVSSRRTSFMAGLSHGKPMVTTTGHLTEPFWSRHSAVALASAGDTRAFVEHVRRLSRDSSGRLRAGRDAHQLYQDQFDLSRTILALRRAGSAKEPECAF